MRFHAEHQFAGSVGAVVGILADPSFTLELELPDLDRPELMEQRHDNDQVTLRFRYVFTGSLDPIAERLLGSDRLAWIQEVRIDVPAGTGSLRIEAEKDPHRLHGSAEFALTDQGAGALRRIDGELVVAVPAVGRMAERRIVPGLLRRMDIEAEAVDERLQTGA